MDQAITIVLNGVETSVPELQESPTIATLVQTLGFRADRVALERNAAIVPRADWSATPVLNGDRIELVHFVGGGHGL